jgi:phenylalanyl-tRNA synthetase alpha chain
VTEAGELKRRFEEARSAGLRLIEEAQDLDTLQAARVRILGRKSELSAARSALRDVPASDRRDLGKLAVEVQTAIEEALRDKQARFEEAERARRFERERIDVTLPGTALGTGTLHPLTATIWQIVDVLVGLGFRVAEGPDVELTRYNFDALNTPFDHPSRSPSDTFYLEGRDDVVLRTQTSPVQIRALELQQPPVYVVAPGRVYRRDAQDPTHLSGFTQIEGLAVDKNITLGDLKGTLQAFAQALFGEGLDTRLRPHFFPFTEPSAELDVQCFGCMGQGCRICKGEGWIEVLGCGMVHPFLLEWVGYDSERYTGFAFGMGVERIAALAHGVNDIRYFWENDLRFLTQFKGAI